LTGSEAEVVTKELLKAEIDRVPDEHLGVLYRIVKALEEPAENPEIGKLEDSAWKALLKAAYGSTADAPIERGEQGSYEVREPLE
jgi:hypothetical protein